MGKYVITGPDGKKYSVTGDSAEGAVAALRKMLGDKPAQRSDVMAAGLADLSGATKDPAAAFDAQKAAGGANTAPQRTVGQAIYDNVIGDPNDGVDSVGEKIGRGINDMARAGAAGLSRGVTGIIDLPANAASAYSSLVTGGLESAGVVSPQFAESMRDGMASAFTPLGGGVTSAASDVTGGATEFKGETLPGKFTGTVAEFLPATAVLGGLNPANLVRFGVIPGVTSEAAGQATEGTALEPYARFAGAMAGSFLPGLLEAGVRKAISPHGGADPERLKLAQVLDDAGVPLTAGQRVGSEALRRKEALTAGGRAFTEAQSEAFTRAVLKTAGTDATRATSEVLAETAKRIGDVFDDVLRGVDVTPDANSVSALSSAVNTYKSLAPTADQAPIIGAVFKEVTKAFRSSAAIPATTVSTWRSTLSKLMTSPNPATREAAQQALGAIDDLIEGALKVGGKAADIARLAEARGQWRNFLAIQKAATASGEGAAVGLLSPSAVRSAVVQQGRSAYAQGRRGEIGDLSKAAEGVMKPLPTSGTAENLRAMMGPSALWSALGAGVGMGTPVGPMIGAGLGSMLPTVMGALRMSPMGQAYLANQLVKPTAAVPFNALAPALTAISTEKNLLP